MPVKQLYLPANRAFNSNGFAVPGAIIRLYVSGGTTPAPMYSDAALTVSVGTSLVANGAGRFATVYQNDATPFRLKVEDAAGVELDDIDPYYFGTLTGAIIGNTTVLTFATRGLLAGVTGTSGSYALLTEAGRDGTFLWSTANLSAQVTADPLQGVYIAPTAASTGATGAWVRSFFVSINPKWFGAVGSTAVDDTIPVQSCIDLSAVIKRPVQLPAAIKFGAVTLAAGAQIVGLNSTVTAMPGTYSHFTVTGSDTRIEGLRIECIAKTGGYDLTIATGVSVIERTTIRNVLTFNSRGGINDTGTTGTHVTTRIESVQFRGHNGPGVNCTRGKAFFFFNEVTVDYVGVPTSNFTGFTFSQLGLGADAGGIFLRDCDVLGTAGTTNLALQRGFDISNAAAVSIFNSRADTLGDKGFTFNTVNKLTLVDVSSALNAGFQFEFTNVTNSTGVGVNSFGRKGLAYAPAGMDGIRFVTGNATLNITGGISRDNTGHGVHKTAAQAGSIAVRSMHSASNTGRGVLSVGNSAFQFNGTLAGNTAGNYDIAGVTDYVSATQLDSGAVVSVGPGPLVA